LLDQTNNSSLSNTKKNKIAYISSYPPRECGIATFTKNLVTAAIQLGTLRKPVIVAMNQGETLYNYDNRVKCQIRRDSPQDYSNAAECINSSKAELVNLQHEFGLYGGEWGEYINIFLENNKKPVVTTLHTLSPSFIPKAQTVLKQIAKHSTKIVTMTNTANQILTEYNVPRSKIEVIQHGCPDVPFVDSNKVKSSLFGLKGKIVLSTFGLISRGKGIEYAIKALPEIVKKYPDILYLIIGETHPEVRKFEGEKYRKKLIKLVKELNLHENVKFHNRFLLKRELIKYLQATDIYITPYIEPNQISSGTLVYAMGTGKAIIATPYLHAIEALAEGRGLLCKFKNYKSITEQIFQLLQNEQLRQKMQKAVYNYSRDFIWAAVVKKYAALYRRILSN
jgi:glycosyltransferase involved in cell wall biosynthesis